MHLTKALVVSIFCFDRFVKVSSTRDAESIIKEFNHYSFGTKYRLLVKLTESEEDRARKLERIKEDEEFYEQRYQEYIANLENKENSEAAVR